ncbi:MAG: hypothetical protein LUD73_06015 [Lachnospiraceae bacterium]|nr:hypothetical protein [Lachnospiraceae bacterium]
MINEEKVILMTRASRFETKGAQKELKAQQYFRPDYLRQHLLWGWFFVTLCYVLGVALWAVCRMEYLMENLHKMDLQSLGMTLAAIYIIVTLVYLGLLYLVYHRRYQKAGKDVSEYAHILKKISDIYDGEERTVQSGRRMKETEHGNIT